MLPRLLPLAITSIMTLIVCPVATALCCLPLIPVALLLAFISEVVVLEGCGYIDAMKRSFNLVAFDWGKVFVVSLLVSLVIWLVSFIVSISVHRASDVFKSHPRLSGMDEVVHAAKPRLDVRLAVHRAALHDFVRPPILRYPNPQRRLRPALLAQNMQKTDEIQGI